MVVNIYQNSVYPQNKQLIEEYRKAYRLTDRDNVHIHVLPKGKAGKKAGSFIYKPLSARASRLQLEVNSIKRKIKELEFSDSHSEKLSTLNKLRVMKKYAEGKLNAEIASLPMSGFVVVEEDE